MKPAKQFIQSKMDLVPKPYTRKDLKTGMCIRRPARITRLIKVTATRCEYETFWKDGDTWINITGGDNIIPMINNRDARLISREEYDTIKNSYQI